MTNDENLKISAGPGRPPGSKNLDQRDPVTIGLALKDREMVYDLAVAGLVSGVLIFNFVEDKFILPVIQLVLTVTQAIWGGIGDAVGFAKDIVGDPLGTAKKTAAAAISKIPGF